MEHVVGYVVTAVCSVIVGLVLQRFRDRANLLYWIPGSFEFHLKNPDLILRTDSLTIQNVGRVPATNIEIIHKARPDHFQFSTPIGFSESTSPTGEHVINIASLGAQEHVNLQLLSHTAIPVLLGVRCAEQRGELIAVQLQRLYPRWLQVIAPGLLLIGAGFSIYWIASAVIYLSKGIGVVP